MFFLQWCRKNKEDFFGKTERKGKVGRFRIKGWITEKLSEKVKVTITDPNRESCNHKGGKAIKSPSVITFYISLISISSSNVLTWSQVSMYTNLQAGSSPKWMAQIDSHLDSTPHDFQQVPFYTSSAACDKESNIWNKVTFNSIWKTKNLIE